MKQISQETINGIVNMLANTDVPARVFVAITAALDKLEQIPAPVDPAPQAVEEKPAEVKQN